MPAPFPPWADTAFRIVLIGGALAVPGLFLVSMIYVRTPYNLNREFPIAQPVQFDHRHHVGDDGIECLYCHSDAERTPFAGVPATEVCMGCHSQIWTAAQMLEPVRRSYFTGEALRWNRVHDVPDFVYFNHAIHVSRAGIACAECHGDVRAEPLVHRQRLFTMGWCIDCHRSRSATLALEPLVTLQERTQRLPPPAIGRRASSPPAAEITNCTTCHR
jgi:hypothetical protein